ncbi:hypothetical protein NM208_g17056 [Fusarium decemcellulare]|uniref:Uncharacterized protein n=1 Tax=Fusarium decemcellulare TaxID=57161 RepID=A0ACC1RBU8_9HYPO|nr:hypothetical protein NM208_g17056 [Fusarium decemcellulare]
MRFFNTSAAVLALALSNSCSALKATILADTNRDGKVDVKGDTDIKGKAEWTSERGALILANIGDTDRRCSKKLPDNDSASEVNEAFLNKCNDATDNVQRNAKYLAPLRTLPIAKLSYSAKGSIHVTDDAAAKNIRVFVKEGNDWTYVAANHTFTAQELQDGLELGVDARDVRRPTWDGKAQVHFTVQDGTQKAEDSVALRALTSPAPKKHSCRT